MLQKISKILEMLFSSSMVLLFDDDCVRLFVNHEPVPIQSELKVAVFLEKPEYFLERFSNEVNRIIKVKCRQSLVKPLFLLILNGRSETVDSKSISGMFTKRIQCGNFIMMRWSEAEKEIGKSLEEVCREFPYFLRGLKRVNCKQDSK